MLKKTMQKGFTIVELLIVIVVIAILAALVLNTFAGVQQRARDTERTTDIKAIASQLEVFYADHGNYPSLGQLNNATWRDNGSDDDSGMPGVDEGAFTAPQQTGSSLVATGSDEGNPTKDEYVYAVADENGDSCEVTDPMAERAVDCQQFSLSWKQEGGDEEVQTIESLN